MKQIQKFSSIVLLAMIFIILNPLQGYASPLAEVGTPTPAPSPEYFSSELIQLEDGTELELSIINGPPEPPRGYTLERLSSALFDLSLQSGTQTLNVPAYRWSFGCSPTSGSMIAAYYDRNGFPDLYTGPTNGGVMPLDNSVWSFWVSGCSQIRYQNPLSASRQGLDGKATEGHVDDYWTCIDSTADDPYLGPPGWPQHDYDSIADFMYTSRSDAYSYPDPIPDGATSFHFDLFENPLLCSTLEGGSADDLIDGTLGLKHFYESRGYSVSDCYSQKTDNQYTGGFSFEDFKAEIDSGHPVMLHVEGHTMVGVGYADPGPDYTHEVYLHDTWDYGTYSMDWGGSYIGMDMFAVSIVHISSPEIDLQGAGLSIADGDSTPSLEDATDYGSTEVSGEVVAHTFTIENTGDGDLNLAGDPKVSISGEHAGDFTVTSLPTSPVAPGGGTTTFEITFDPSDEGVRTATVSIDNDDSDENPYDFAIMGIGVLPEMDLQGGGLSIADGDSTPSVADDTDFGSTNVSEGSVVHTFTIENTGSGDLNLTGGSLIQLLGTPNGDWMVTSQPTTPVPAGGTTTFEITFDPSSEGLHTATVSIANDDSDENPYDFAIQGTGTVLGAASTPADFDGNGDTDISVFRPSNGKWYIYGEAPVWWGMPGDIPVPANYDGDSDTDMAVFRPSNGKWYVYGESPEWWGMPDDVPMQGDYDNDGSADLAVFRPSNGKWYLYGEAPVWWGMPGDIPVPGDYDGNGSTDIAVFRPSNGKWYLYGEGPVWWGMPGDIPVPGDYDGNGSTDIAVYRPSNGKWYMYGEGPVWWGMPGDIPVPGDYDGNGSTDIAVVRPANGKWYIMGGSTIWHYLLNDFPLPVRDTNGDGDEYQ